MLALPPFNRLYPSHFDNDGAGKYLALAEAVVETSFADSDSHHQYPLASFIGQGVTKDEAINELVLQGRRTDSTATAIRMTLLFLITNPVAHTKLREEIDDAIRSGKASSPIKDAEARKLPYLQAVIKEGARASPPVPAPVFKKVSKGGDSISGYFVPEGTEIGHNLLGIMRAKKYWGDDADVFRPERWIEADSSTYGMMTGALEILWGSGRHKCLGRALAQMQLNKVFFELLRHFDFSVVSPQSPVEIMHAAFQLMSEMQLRVTRRQTV